MVSFQMNSSFGRMPNDQGNLIWLSPGTRVNILRHGGMTMGRLVMLAFLIAFFLFWNAPAVTAQFREAGVEKLRVAVDAPDLTLKELGGGKISLKELRGKIILLNFFASW